MERVKVPLRVPPPRAESITEQWIIDALLHLDECIDDAKTQNATESRAVKDGLAELRAEVTASLAAGRAVDNSLEERIEAHEAEHIAIDVRHKAQRGVWQTQYGWAREAAKAGFEVGKFAVGLGLLRLLGIL